MGRAHVVWLSFVGVAAVAVAFALGVVVGRRAERIDVVPPDDPLAQIEADGHLHDKLTFYSTLTESPRPEAASGGGIRRQHDGRRPGHAAAPRQPVQPPRAGVDGSDGAGKGVAPSTDVAARHAAGGGVASRRATAEVAPRPAGADDQATAAPTARSDRERSVAAALARVAGQGSSDAPATLRGHLNAGPPAPGEYTVQVSSFQSMDDAKAFSATLERKGFKPFVVTSAVPGKGLWHRVRLGRFASAEQAAQAKQLLAEAKVTGWVLRSE